MKPIPDASPIELTQAQKLVLFEFLSRSMEDKSLAIIDQAEEEVLSIILAKLEKQLSEPFRPDYKTILANARLIVRGGARYPCPCCSNFTLPSSEKSGLHSCPVCGWIDDEIQFSDPNLRPGANYLSLNEAKELFKSNGYANEEIKGRTRKPYLSELPAQN